MTRTRSRILLAAAGVFAGLILSVPAARESLAGTSGRVEEHALDDSTYHRVRRVWVYTPPGYDPRRAAPYPLILCFDGAQYREETPLPLDLDTLLAAHRAPAFVAVLVDDSSRAVRLADLANAPRMVTFLGGQLVPWIRRGWHVTRDPRRVIVMGSSAGGLAAAHVALARPELFGNVWSQSGAFWRGADASNGPPWEWLTAQVAASPRKEVRFALDVGAAETHATLGGSGPNFLEATRRFRDALKRKGYGVTYTEVPGGVHGVETWRPRLAAGIEALVAQWDRP